MAYTGTSLVDYLNSVGQASDLTTRAQLAARYGISNYIGSAAQNTQLLNTLRSTVTPPSTNFVTAPNTNSTNTTSPQVQTSSGSDALANLQPPQINASTLLAPILSGQIDPNQIDGYLQQQVLNIYQKTFNRGTGDNTYLNMYYKYAPSFLNQTKQQLNGQNISYGGQNYNFQNGQAVKTSTTLNQSTVSGNGVSSASYALGGTPSSNKAPDDPTNQYNTQTGKLNPGWIGNQYNTQTGQLNPNYQKNQYNTLTGQANPYYSGASTISGNSDTSTNPGGIIGTANTLISSGYTIPSTLQITPTLVSQFLSWAHQNVDPQTQQALSSEIASVNNDLQNQQTQYDLQRGQTVQDFGARLLNQDNTAGNNGVAFSGGRQLADNNLVNSTNRSLDSLASTSAYNASNSLQQGANLVGSANANQFNLPTFAIGAVKTGGSQLGTYASNGNRALNYNPSLYTVGQIPSTGSTNVANLQGNYLSQYGNLASSNSNGSRSISDLISMMSGLPSGYQIPSNLK